MLVAAWTAAAAELEAVTAVDVNRRAAVDRVPVVVIIEPRGEGARSPLLASHCNERGDASVAYRMSTAIVLRPEAELRTLCELVGPVALVHVPQAQA